MKPIGSADIRQPNEQERACLPQEIRDKASIVEWRSGLDIPGDPAIKLMMNDTPDGRRFDLVGRLNGWSSPQQAVEKIAQLGLIAAQAHGLMPQEQIDRALVGIFRNMELLPHMSEFRARSYAAFKDYKPSVEHGTSMMPEYFFEKPVERIGAKRGEQRFDEFTVRKIQLPAATERVFPPNSKAGLLTQLVLYAAAQWSSRETLDKDRVWKAVVDSIVAGGLRQDEVERAVTSKTAASLAARIDKVAGRESDDLIKVFRRHQRQGFDDLAKSLDLDRAEVRRDVLCVLVDSFWDLPAPWTLVMGSIRALIKPTLLPMETAMYDRLYLPQDYLAGLPPYLLWPRRDIVMPLSLRLLTTPLDEAWRFDVIPHCLEVFGSMDDCTRQSDRARKETAKFSGRGSGRPPVEELSEGGDDHSVLDEFVDPGELNKLLNKMFASGPVPCPHCHQPATSFEVNEGETVSQVAVRLQPCGCSLSPQLPD